MSKAAFAGPIIAFGVGNAGTGYTVGESNPDLGPSVFCEGTALLDMRWGYHPGQASSHGIFAWGPSIMVPVLDVVAATLTATAIAAAALAVAGTPMTLVTSTAAGVTVGQSITNALTGAAVTGLLSLGGVRTTPSVVNFGGTGQTGIVNLYDPTKMLSRAVRIVSAGGDDTLATFTVAGYDVYGFPMTEAIIGANAGTATGKKAFAYIASVTPSGTIGSTTVSVGTTDIFGFPLRIDTFGYAQLFVATSGAVPTLVTANTGFVAADTTSPATTTTGDARGTYALQSASDGTKRQTFFQRVSVANLALGNVGLTGVQQV